MKAKSAVTAIDLELTCPRCMFQFQRPGGDQASAHTMGEGCVAFRSPPAEGK